MSLLRIFEKDYAEVCAAKNRYDDMKEQMFEVFDKVMRNIDKPNGDNPVSYYRFIQRRGAEDKWFCTTIDGKYNFTFRFRDRCDTYCSMDYVVDRDVIEAAMLNRMSEMKLDCTYVDGENAVIVKV